MKMARNLILFLVQLSLLAVLTLGRKLGRSSKLSHRDKLMIINYHNDIRRSEFSSDMEAMSWDPDAANKAREWGSDCIFNRLWDDNYGENIYKTYFTKALRPREVMMDALKSWETEKQNLFSWDAKCTDSETCNYKQLVNAKVDSVGCALIKCPRMIESKKTTDYDMYYFLCFYSPRVPLDQQPFTYGRKCSKCPAGYSCKKKLCTKPHWQKILQNNKHKTRTRPLSKPVKNVVIQEDSRGYQKLHNVSSDQSNVIHVISPAALTGSEPSEKIFNGVQNVHSRIKRQTRYSSYDEWYRRERARRERLRHEQLYRREVERRRREQERRRNSRPSRPSELRRPYRLTNAGSISSEEQNYLTQAHNLLRGNVKEGLKWSRYIQRWADYVIRCNVEYPGPITMYTNFGKVQNGGNIYNIVYDWGSEGYNTRQALKYGCRTPSDRELCNHNTIIQNEFIREFACAALNCSDGNRQLTCIYR